MRYVLVVICACLFLQVSCFRRSFSADYRKLTGTCQGACDHYVSCKYANGQRVTPDTHVVCERECQGVFSGTEPLVAFESLSCEDAIAFVEGDTGRGPGE